MSRSQILTKSDYLTVLLLLALLLIGLALNAPSQGYNRGGDDDDGSGIGGTGRYPGAIDVNGALKPFLGYDERAGEVIILELTEPPLTPPAPVQPGDNFNISDAARRPVALPEPFARVAGPSAPLDIAASVTQRLEIEAYYFNPQELGLLSAADSVSMSWTDLKQILTVMRTDDDRRMDNGNASEQNAEERPEQSLPRFRRPDLPPVQRVRPVDRISVVPPRVTPMRI